MYTEYLWIIIGGALGTAARYWMTAAVASVTGPAFPWGTLLINIIGSFVIGLFDSLTDAGSSLSSMPEVKTLVMVGICGGFTTFSSFNLQTLELMRAREFVRAGAYVLASVLLCLVAVWLGTLL